MLSASNNIRIIGKLTIQKNFNIVIPGITEKEFLSLSDYDQNLLVSEHLDLPKIDGEYIGFDKDDVTIIEEW